MGLNRGNRISHYFAVPLLTACVFAALGFGFQIKSPNPAVRGTGTDDSREIQRITLPSDRRSAPPELYPLLDYMSALDPTIMTHPTDIKPHLNNLDVGLYDRRGEFRRERQALPIARSRIELPLSPPLPPRPVASPIDRPMEAITRAWLHAAPPPLQPAAEISRRDSGVYWVDEDGRELGFFPRLNTNALENINLVAHHPTVLEVIPPARALKKADVLPSGRGLPRTRVVRSSGNAALDQVAHHHLRRFMAKEVVGGTSLQQQAWLTVARTVTVHWEHVAGMSYRSDWQGKLEPDQVLELPWYDLNQH